MSSVAQTEISPVRSAGIAPTVAFVASLATLALLALLHIVSPEFDPSWRMVSEYALGAYPWLLSAFFLCWALGSWALAVSVWPLARGWMVKTGVAFLTLSGLGEALAAFFDVNAATMHGLAGAIGVPTLPIAALLISYGIDRAEPMPGRRAMRLTAHLTWISLIAMAASMALFFSTYTAAGGNPGAGVPSSLPEGTVALHGWANRLLIICYCAWNAVSARRLMKADAGAGAK